jgi:hypothetical protein
MNLSLLWLYRKLEQPQGKSLPAPNNRIKALFAGQMTAFKSDRRPLK